MTTTGLTIIADEVVDPCAPWSAIVRAGQTLQIIDLHGNQAVDTLLYGVSGDHVDHTLRYSHHTVHQHACAENFLAEGAKWGLGKRDIVSNINFFMNVPVEADGTLGIVDGLSAPGKSLT